MKSSPFARYALGALTAGALLVVAGCGVGSTDDAAGPSSRGHGSGSGHHQAKDPSASSPTTSTSPSESPKPKKHYPTGPPMLLDSIFPLDHSTVGVAMPISMNFSTPVKPSARKGIEQSIQLTTSAPIKGAWSWLTPQRLDFRPEKYWPSGTKVSMIARFKHVGDGYGRYGTHGYTRTFTIGDDIRTHVMVNQHKTVVTKDGKVLRSMPSNAGSPEFPSWDGVMAVTGTSSSVRMTSCSVGIACSKSDPNYYDLTLPWDVQITTSGTFLHYSTGDPYPGDGNGSHGCVHLSYDNAEWFYHLSKMGDPVLITGSPRGKAAPDNGFADYNESWTDWLKDSGMGEFTTSTTA